VDVKGAVRIAVRHVQELFEAEDVSNVGLEEIFFNSDDNTWIVTVGFSRPWDYQKAPRRAGRKCRHGMALERRTGREKHAGSGGQPAERVAIGSVKMPLV
jgi:hypothetical protein